MPLLLYVLLVPMPHCYCLHRCPTVTACTDALTATACIDALTATACTDVLTATVCTDALLPPTASLRVKGLRQQARRQD
jgi:hypothetical protein